MFEGEYHKSTVFWLTFGGMMFHFILTKLIILHCHNQEQQLPVVL